MPHPEMAIPEVGAHTKNSGADSPEAALNRETAEPEAEFDRTALEATTKQRLAAVFGDEPAVEETTDTGEQDAADDTTQDEVADQDDQGGEETTETISEAAVEDSGDPDAPTLPDAYRRTLEHKGWKPEEIDHNLKALGPQFIAQVEKLHVAQNAENAALAMMGRQIRAQESPLQEASGQTPETPPATVKAIPAVDVQGLKEKFGEDELVDAIAAPINAAVEAMNAILPNLHAGQEAAQQAEVDRVSQSVETFFSEDSKQAYTELYGHAKVGLTDTQVTKRNEVLDHAYNLIVGAREVQGREISLSDAMEMAHNHVSREFDLNAVRHGIVKKAKAREKGITLRPSNRSEQSTLTTPNGPPSTRQELESRTRARLRKVFG